MRDELVHELFQRHRRDVFRFLRHLGRDEQLAEDLTQETFMRLTRAAEPAHLNERERPYLIRMARNLYVDHWRRQRSLAVLPADAAQAIPDPGPAPDDVFELHEALGTLKPLEREAFLLCELGGLRYAEIAGVLDVSTDAVRSLIYRARCALRARLRTCTATRGEGHDRP